MRTSTTALGVLFAALVSTHAFAQEAPAQPAAPAQASPPKAPPQPSGISEEAKRHFAAGVTLLQDPEGEKVEEAYREFRTAYDLSSSPKILGNMGFCAMRLERDGEAIDAYSRYLREVPDIDADERAQIVRDLQTLTVGVARISIEVNKPGVRILDVRIPVRGDRITNAYGPVTNGKLEIGIRPGHHVITAKLPDHEDETWELDAYAATRDKRTFTMRERVVAPPPSAAPVASSTNVGPYIVMGIGGAMLVGGAITGIVALGQTSDIESKCPGDVCPNSFDLEDARSTAKTFVRVTDVMLIGGAIVGAGGLAWLLLSGSGSKEAPKAASVAPARMRPVPLAGCSAEGCRASVKVAW
ncbi:MAG: hypothetical protein JST00_24285 [Deltaproteobacteria bacterium]|nr:hypothetical protein [Deltaproteobacteria bacterium]